MKMSRRALLSIWSALVLALASGVAYAQKAPNNTKPIRIAAIFFMHETVTFLPYDTQLSDFIYEGSPARGEALLGSDPNGYMLSLIHI